VRRIVRGRGAEPLTSPQKDVKTGLSEKRDYAISIIKRVGKGML